MEPGRPARSPPGGFDRRINLWNADGTLRQTYQPMGNAVTTVAFSSDSRRLLVTLGGVASDVKECHVLDVHASRWLTRFAEHPRSVITGSLSQRTARWRQPQIGMGLCYLWRTDTGARTRSLVARYRIPWSAGWGPDSKTIAWGLTDRSKTLEAGNPLECTFQPRRSDSFGGPPGADATAAWLIRGTQSSLQTTTPRTFPSRTATSFKPSSGSRLSMPKTSFGASLSCPATELLSERTSSSMSTMRAPAA